LKKNKLFVMPPSAWPCRRRPYPAPLNPARPWCKGSASHGSRVTRRINHAAKLSTGYPKACG